MREMGNKLKRLKTREIMGERGMNKMRKRLIRKTDQGAACGHPYERRDDQSQSG